MAVTAERLQVIVEAEVDKAVRDLKKVNKATDKTEKGFKGLGTVLKGAAVAGGIAIAGQAIFNVGKELFDAAATAEETTSKFNAVFKEQAEVTRAWAENYSRSFGLSSTETLGFLATLQDTFVPLGFARDRAADLSTQLVDLAGDLSSFNNVARADVVRDLQSALVGNTETLRKYGIVASQAAIEQEAINSGLIESKSELDASTKAQAIYQLTLKGTTDAQGDLERTQDSAANTARRLGSSYNDLKITLGQVVTESATPFLGFLSESLNKINDTIKAQRELEDLIKGVEEGTASYAQQLELVLIEQENLLSLGFDQQAQQLERQIFRLESLAIKEVLATERAQERLAAVEEQARVEAEREQAKKEADDAELERLKLLEEQNARLAAQQANFFGLQQIGFDNLTSDLDAIINREQIVLDFKDKQIDKQEELNAKIADYGDITRQASGIIITAVNAVRDAEEGAGVALRKLIAERLEAIAVQQGVEALVNTAQGVAALFFNPGAASGFFSAASLNTAAAIAAGAGASAIGSFQTGTGSSGFTVPPGFENDSFPVQARSGETVTVTRPGESRQESMNNVKLIIGMREIGRIIFEGTKSGAIKIDQRAVVRG